MSSTEIAINLQMSPCDTKMHEANIVEAFNSILQHFVEESLGQEGITATVAANIKSQSIFDQRGLWRRFRTFYRKVYTKRYYGDPVGQSRIEVKEILALNIVGATATEEQRLPHAIKNIFQGKDSSDHLIDQLLSSPGTSSFFSAPRSLQVVAIKQNRHAGVRLSSTLGCIGALIAFICLSRCRRTRKRAAPDISTTRTSTTSCIVPEIIDISYSMSSIGVASPASVDIASHADAAVWSRNDSAMPPTSEERDTGIEKGRHSHCDRRRRHISSLSKGKSNDVHYLTVVVPAGYPEELGFSVNGGTDALQISKVQGDSPLSETLRLGDMIAEVDGKDTTRWNEERFEEFLVERRRHKKKLLIERKGGENGNDEIKSCFASDEQTEMGDESSYSCFL